MPDDPFFVLMGWPLLMAFYNTFYDVWPDAAHNRRMCIGSNSDISKNE